MPTPHINAKEGDFAKVFLMPGDPVRAKWMADTFLTDYVQVTNVRGILGFTGHTKNGKKLSIMASGMGMPSIGIYSYELFTGYGVEIIIRVGTCGAYQPYINVKDILIGTSASTDSNWISQYHLGGFYAASADYELLVTAHQEAVKAGVPFHGGNILSSDVFYDNDKDAWKKWAELGVLGVEMEAFALYTNAAKLGKKALCLLTVSDSFIKPEVLSSDERAFSLTRMIELAIATAEHFCD